MWTFLSFLVCSSANVCSVTIPYAEPLPGLAACQRDGMLMVPSWEVDHPGMTVKKIRCTIGKRPHAEDAV